MPALNDYGSQKITLISSKHSTASLCVLKEEVVVYLHQNICLRYQHLPPPWSNSHLEIVLIARRAGNSMEGPVMPK